MAAAEYPAGTGLPAGLAPPVKVALAKVVTKMPRARPGNLLYEPKWDGYIHWTLSIHAAPADHPVAVVRATIPREAEQPGWLFAR
ncbi:hypothetical protein [Arthrobacter sp. NPDC057009]|uniref:hypothetical protein n=1 Tax=Arthrobacter sp. NPDC057009 TaxID=3345996 RepID=UPI003639F03E